MPALAQSTSNPPLRCATLAKAASRLGSRCHIARNAEGAVAQFLRRLFRLIQVAGHDGNLGTSPSKYARNALADSLGAAGNDDGAALK